MNTSPPSANPITALEALARAYDLVIIYAFGSRGPEIAARVRGQAGGPAGPPASDVDIGVLAAPGHTLTIHDKVRLALAFEDLFDVPQVDLVSLRQADPFLAANVVRGERIYAGDDYLADEYDLYVLRRAGDLEPLERERMALILGEET